MSNNPNRLLIVEDHPDMMDFIAEVGIQLGFEVFRAEHAAGFMQAYHSCSPTLIILDLQIPGSDPLETLRWLAAQQCATPIVLASGVDRDLLAASAELGLTSGLNIVADLHKPIPLERLESVLIAQTINLRRISEIDVQRALDRSQLRVHYLPIVAASLADRRIVGVEALLRWEHPEYGLVMPQEFIGIAERHGSIAALTDFVLQSGIEQLAEWDQLGFSTRLNVNLSPRIMTNAGFPEQLEELMRRMRIDITRMTIETTEGSAIDQPRPTLDILTRLRLRGVELALDDFGTGYSSLTQLYELPFSELKIDRTLGRELPHNAKACTVVGSLVQLGHSLGLKVCCEGVESAQALEFLEHSGCDLAQGYFIAAPMIATSLPEFAQSWISRPIARARGRRTS